VNFLIASSTKILGLLGYPLGHSISFYIHNKAFQVSSIDAIYLNIPISPEYFSEAIKGLKFLPIWGLNITVPFKEKIIEFLDELSETSKILGAVNTVFVDDKGRWIGDNTDLPGFLKTIQELNLNKDLPFLILGAGGAARAVIYALIEYGVKNLFISNRTEEKADRLIEEVSDKKGFLIQKVLWKEKENLKEKLVLINTTSVGLDGKSNPWKGTLRNVVLVYDIIYNPFKTPIIFQAEEEKIPWKNGLDMLIYQAAYSWERWFGILGPVDIMRREAFDIICAS